MIEWANAGVLPWLWALLPLAALLILLEWRRERRLRLLLEDEAAAQLSPERRRALGRVKTLLWFLACALALVSLARPKWGIRWQEARGRGRDILVVLDTSRSMQATDLRPSRLQRAKWGVSDLVGRLSGERIGLVAFAGSAFLQCPLTTDYAAFSMMLEDVRPGTIPRGGTSLAQALETALRGFETAGETDRVVVLVSDGEDHEGGLEKAAAALAERHVRVLAVGVGTLEGSTIPVAESARGEPLRDRAGNVVRTALREDVLERIAATTGGAYVRAAAENLALDRLLNRGAPGAGRQEKGPRLVKVYEERFPWFLGAALLLLSLEALVGERRRGRAGGAR